MKKKKLKAYVLPTVYTMAVMVIFASMMFMNASLNTEVDEEIIIEDSNYVIEVVTPDEVPVVSEVDNSVSKPYLNESVSVTIDYYSKDDEASVQESSLIYYNNTYMQNTGIMYSADEEFDVVATFSGTVKNISEDEILGTVIEIEHTSDYTSFYYSVTDAVVSIGDVVEKGDVIAISGTSEIEKTGAYNLLFEVYYQGKAIDPNSFYELEIEN